MSTMRFGGYTNVSYEQATTGAEMMQEVIASMRASAGEEMVAIPRGIALVAGGFIAPGKGAQRPQPGAAAPQRSTVGSARVARVRTNDWAVQAGRATYGCALRAG